ncbi:MAG: flagellar hook-basal body protein FliE [Naasia sp.]|jgi:flagellar hook-basal body complex protein FliE|uniref:flagellar hook-basal body complex protein FliE n=1 Tax=Naasia sp. TaxID=2546198 RepID=UPI0026384731|nr:flagellar hook-basal body complex protein FliE [Naasia sp.]MCU1570966.1 flagellar hook-basal body protein FliE [Naasia sp.]
MPIPAIGAISSVVPTFSLPSTAPASGSGGGFSNMLTSAVDNLQNTQNASNELAVKAVTGDLSDIHQATIAATRAQVTLELVAAVRNKGVEAFNDIMRMQA